MSEEAPGLRPEDLSRASQISEAVERYHRSLPNFDPESPASSFRHERKKAWLNAAVPSLLGSEDAEAVCRRWSAEADRLLNKAFEECFPPDLALFALGKLGARELNLSSDVDLLIVSREERPEDLVCLRRFQKLLSETTPEGFVFRVDFDLRPGGRMGPLIPSLDHLTDYYGNYGETWERMAFVRLRPVAGDPKLASEVLDFTARFSYRKHLDFTLFEELKNMRAKIHAEHWKRSEGDWIDLKLGIGGIRDVELFFHALQVIHGGKDPGLRVRETSAAARILAVKKLLPVEDATFLIDHYWGLRGLENYVQALGDKQTHLILSTASGLPAPLQMKLDSIFEDLRRTDEIVSSLLGEAPRAPSASEIQSLYSEENVRDSLGEILAIPLLSRHRERDEQTRRSFLMKFLEVLREQKADPVMAVDQLKDFLKAVRAKSTFFALLLREESLLREIAWLFGHSRYLGRLLCFRPELLDSFVFRNQDLSSKDLESLLEALAEKKLLSEIIEGSRFLRDHDLERATAALTSSADSIVTTLAEAIREEYPSQVSILALGKWGGRETGFRSDLDLIFVHPGEPQEADLKFAKRVISRLTDAHRGGSIYPVDLRLRPSGKAGPLVISVSDLVHYLEENAAAWERQAYLRSRWVGPNLADLRPALLRKSLGAEDLRELNRIRTGLLPKQAGLDLKYSEGGLVDLELFVQTLILMGQKAPVSGNTLELLRLEDQSRLREIYMRLRQVEQLMQLISLESTPQIHEENELSQRLAASLNFSSSKALREEMESLLEESRSELLRLDPRRSAG